MMKVAIIGPSDIKKISAATGIGGKYYEEYASKVGMCLAEAGDELVVVPDRGIPVLAAQSYRKSKGVNVIGLIPRSGVEAQQSVSECEKHRDLCDTVIDDMTWFDQHVKLCETADALVCIGLSCGTICEVAWTKWTGKKPVLILQKTISNLPKEIVAETNIIFIRDLNNLKRILEGIRVKANSEA